MYKSIFYFILLLIACSCDTTGSPANYSAKHPPNTSYDTLSFGKELFSQKCTICHGDDGRLGISGAKILPDTKLHLADVITQVKNGKNGMPSFHQVLNEEQILAVAKYVLTLKDTIH